MCHCTGNILILFSVSFFLSSSNSKDLDLTLNRNTTTRGGDRNQITLRCADILDDVPQSNFFITLNRTTLITSLVRVTEGVLLSITRETEGDYNCIVSQRRSNNLPLVALPNINEMIQSETFEADFGGTATLECPIPPGAALSRYYVRWVYANDTSRTVAEILRPSVPGNGIHFPLQRYSVNRETFSLLINDSKVPDGDIVYRCIPGVEDYNSAVEYLYDEETVGVHQTLVVNRGPEITYLSDNQQLSTSESRSATIRCCVLSAPSYSRVTWVHKGNTVRENNTKYVIHTQFRVNSDTSEGGYITNSTLVVLDLEVLDGGVVKCVAETDHYSKTMTNQSRTMITVLAIDLTTATDNTTTTIISSVVASFILLVMMVSVLIVIILCVINKFKPLRKNVHFQEATSTIIISDQKKENIPVRSLTSMPSNLTEDIAPSLRRAGVSYDYAKMMAGSHQLIPSHCIELSATIGQGEFGIVYRGHIKEWKGRNTPQQVAVKTLKKYFSLNDIENLMRESEKMMLFDHPNVLSLIGVSIDEGRAPYIVMPFMDNGSLLNYLRKERPNLTITNEAGEKLIEESERKLLSMCFQIAKGMSYLTLQKFIHRDLAARNCMIDHNSVIKVADFGLSEDIYSREYFKQGRDGEQGSSVKLPAKWMALESLQQGVFSEKTDVWSFGVTCWEIFTLGNNPYPGSGPSALVNLLENGERLERFTANVAFTQPVYDLISQCWLKQPHQRPSFKILVTTIESQLEEMAGYFDFSATPSMVGSL